MLRSNRKLIGFRLQGLDDEFGKVKDLLFDDRTWTVRYVEVDTGTWLPGRIVLISPVSIEKVDSSDSRVTINLTRQQVEDSPSIAEHEPISRQRENEMVDYYAWPVYWYGWGSMANVAPPPAGEPDQQDDASDRESLSSGEGGSALRSVNEVERYRIHATDGEVGHVKEFIFDTEVWVIRYLVVDTGKWLPGRKVLIAPDWNDRIDWSEKMLYVGLTREQIKASPRYDPSEPINREMEMRLYDYYGRPAYWHNTPV